MLMVFSRIDCDQETVDKLPLQFQSRQWTWALNSWPTQSACGINRQAGMLARKLEISRARQHGLKSDSFWFCKRTKRPKLVFHSVSNRCVLHERIDRIVKLKFNCPDRMSLERSMDKCAYLNQFYANRFDHKGIDRTIKTRSKLKLNQFYQNRLKSTSIQPISIVRNRFQTNVEWSSAFLTIWFCPI